MKKLLVLSSLSLLLSPCSLAKSQISGINVKKVAETTTNTASEVTYLPAEVEGNFTLENSSKDTVTDIATFVRNRTDLFWTTRSYNALDKFFDSINNNGEDWTGTFKSKSFVQTKQYIYFTFGGNATNEVVLIDEDANNAEIGSISNKYFSDPNVSCNMLMYSIEVQEENRGHNMHVEVRDTTSSSFGGVTFGDLHVNQTEEEVAKAYSIYLNNLDYNSNYNQEKPAESTKASRDYIYQLYTNSNNTDLYKFTSYKLTDANVTFAQGNDNLSTLAFDSIYAENLGDFKFDSFISEDTAYDWNEQMPFNNDGYFFNGNGYSSRNEQAKFRFLTNKFTLSGTGLVSIKMAGRPAQLQVLDVTKVGTGEDPILETLDVQDFADNGVANIYLNGSNYNTLHRVYWDLNKYLGKEIILAIADKDTNDNWGMLFFDDLITRYDTLPSFNVDVFSQKHKGSEDVYYGAFTDLYVKASEEEGKYNSAFSEAYDFLSNHYYKTASLDGKKHNYFASLQTQEAKDTVDAYAALSAEAKAIVDSSKDFYFAGEDDNWQKSEPVIANINDRIQAKVKVTYVYNNGDDNKEELVNYKEEFTPETPTKASTWNNDYGFAGWFTNSDFEDEYVSKTLTSDLVLYAKWNTTDSKEVTAIKNSETKAQLAYDYTATTEGETTTYSITNVILRFGGMIKVSDYDAIKDHVKSYGVKLCSALPENTTSLKDALEKGSTFADNKLITRETEVDDDHPIKATSSEKTSDNQDEEYYLFNAYLEVPETNYDTVIYAVSYLKFEDDSIVYLKERSGSVSSIAQEYLDNDKVTKTEAVSETLKQLAGKTEESK